MEMVIESGKVGVKHVSKHQIYPGNGKWAGWRRTGHLNLTGETKLSGANGDRQNSIFHVQQYLGKKKGARTRVAGSSLLPSASISAACLSPTSVCLLPAFSGAPSYRFCDRLAIDPFAMVPRVHLSPYGSGFPLVPYSLAFIHNDSIFPAATILQSWVPRPPRLLIYPASLPAAAKMGSFMCTAASMPDQPDKLELILFWHITKC